MYFYFMIFQYLAYSLLNVYLLCNGNIAEQYLLDFYGEGTERKLLLNKTDNRTIKVENMSDEKWLSPIPSEYVNIIELSFI